MVTRLPAIAGGLAAGVPGLVPLQSGSSDDTLGLIVMFVVGLLLVYHGFRKWQRMRLMQDTPTETVRAAAAGRTELWGTAEPIDGVGTIDQPFAEGECLVATYEVEEWKEDEDDDGSWSTLDSGTLLAPFQVDDGTGTMRVEPEEDATFDISSENRTSFTVDANRTPPGEVVAFFERRYDDGGDGLLARILDRDPSVRGSNERRYTQEVIPPGERVYLLGGARPVEGASGSNADRLVLGRDGGSDEFIVADRSEEELVSSYRWAAPAQIVGGLALSSAMLYLLLA